MAPFSPVSSILPGQQGNIQGMENVGKQGAWDFPCLSFVILSDDQKLYDKKADVSFLTSWCLFQRVLNSQEQW
jgi:hypothetical protein